MEFPTQIQSKTILYHNLEKETIFTSKD